MNKAGGPLISTTGMTETERAKIYRAAGDGEFIRLLPGVFIHYSKIPTERDEFHQLEIVAAAIAHPQSLVVGHSAAVLHVLARSTDLLASKERRPVELGSVTQGIKGRSRNALVNVKGRRVGADVCARSVWLRTRYGTVQVASVLDTCEQLALWHPLDAAVVAIEDALNKKKLAPGALRTHRLKGRTGANQARQALNLVTPWSESPRESELKLRLWGAGLPAPMQQVDIRRHTGQFLGRVDFMFPCGLIVEYDGASKHISDSIDPSDVFEMERTLNDERARERRIMGLGYEFVRVDRRRFRDGSGVEDVVERYADMVENPPPRAKSEKWVWSAKGKAWREPGDPGWQYVR